MAVDGASWPLTLRMTRCRLRTRLRNGSVCAGAVNLLHLPLARGRSRGRLVGFVRITSAEEGSYAVSRAGSADARRNSIRPCMCSARRSPYAVLFDFLVLENPLNGCRSRSAKRLWTERRYIIHESQRETPYWRGDDRVATRRLRRRRTSAGCRRDRTTGPRRADGNISATCVAARMRSGFRCAGTRIHQRDVGDAGTSGNAASAHQRHCDVPRWTRGVRTSGRLDESDAPLATGTKIASASRHARDSG
jgi:hypothetical protein